MSENNTASISLEDVTEDLVIEYLCTHPEFFQTHEDLLERLHIPHACGPATSLIERQVARLRQQNQSLQNNLFDTLQVAKDNEKLFELTKKLTIALLKSRDLKEALTLLHDMLHNSFDIDFVRIGVTDLPATMATPPDIFAFCEKTQPAIKEMLKINKTICKKLPAEQRLYFFADKMKQVRSSAIVVLGSQAQHGFLALGSVDKLKFHRDKDTLFLDYIGKTVGHLLQRLLSDAAS